MYLVCAAGASWSSKRDASIYICMRSSVRAPATTCHDHGKIMGPSLTTRILYTTASEDMCRQPKTSHRLQSAQATTAEYVKPCFLVPIQVSKHLSATLLPLSCNRTIFSFFYLSSLLSIQYTYTYTYPVLTGFHDFS